MNPDYWLRQTPSDPLYPDLQWSRPDNRQFAGKLLIIGGNAQSFAAANQAYIAASRAGIGTARMMLPDVLRKTLGKEFLAGEFVPSTPSGSFAQTALAEAIAMAHWADGVLLAGDLGRNSETAILLEKFLIKHDGPVTITKDAADYCLSGGCADRPDTVLVISFAQLQKLAINAHYPAAFTFDMDVLRLVEHLHGFTLAHPAAIIVKMHDKIFVADKGQVSSTRLVPDKSVWRVETAAAAATWWLQNYDKRFKALTTALVS